VGSNIIDGDIFAPVPHRQWVFTIPQAAADILSLQPEIARKPLPRGMGDRP